jgi:hypothetical protein
MNARRYMVDMINCLANTKKYKLKNNNINKKLHYIQCKSNV